MNDLLTRVKRLWQPTDALCCQNLLREVIATVEAEAALAAPMEGEAELRERVSTRICTETGEPEHVGNSIADWILSDLLRPYLAPAQQQAADAPAPPPEWRGLTWTGGKVQVVAVSIMDWFDRYQQWYDAAKGAKG